MRCDGGAQRYLSLATRNAAEALPAVTEGRNNRIERAVQGTADMMTATQKSSIVELPSGPTDQSLKNLQAYWASAKGDRIAPPRSAIYPEEIDIALLPNIALLDVVGDPPRFRFRLFGTGLVMSYGEDVTGRYVDEIDLSSISPDILSHFTAVVRECRPQTVRTTLWKRADERYIEYERIGLPLSDNGTRVNMILCGFAVIRTWH